MKNPIASSGHSLRHLNFVGRCSRVIHEVDSRLDSLAGRADVFPELPLEDIQAMKPEWRFNFLDFGLLDLAASRYHVFQRGMI